MSNELPSGKYSVEVYSGPYNLGVKNDGPPGSSKPLYFFNNEPALFIFDKIGATYVVKASDSDVRSIDPAQYGDVYAFDYGPQQEWVLQYQPEYNGYCIFTTDMQRAWTCEWVPSRNDLRQVYLHESLQGTDYFGRQVFVFTLRE